MPRFLLVIALCFVSGQLFADSYYVYSMLTGEGEVFGAKVQLFPRWKQTTQFSNDEDWMFASPVQLGRLPWSYPRVLNAFYDAGTAAGIGRLSTHTMRHTYRSWLDAVGAPITVQQKLMRHASVTTTLDVYGDVVTDEMSEAGSKVVGLALNRKVIASVSRWLKTWRRGKDFNPADFRFHNNTGKTAA